MTFRAAHGCAVLCAMAALQARSRTLGHPQPLNRILDEPLDHR
jgi:hypothetical protein